MKHVDTLIPAYHDNMLSAKERSAVEAHLASCDACRAKLRELHDTVSAYNSSKSDGPLLRRALKRMDKRSVPASGNALRFSLRRTIYVALPAAAVLLFALILPIVRAPRYDTAVIASMFTADLYTQESIRSRGQTPIIAASKCALRVGYYAAYMDRSLSADDRSFLADMLADNVRCAGVRMTNTISVQERDIMQVRAKYPQEFETGAALWKYSYLLVSSNTAYVVPEPGYLSKDAAGRSLYEQMTNVSPTDHAAQAAVRRRIAEYINR
ncbi:MAG: zf-HC2 domain-containing protein [Spirochaetota bacterium]